MAVEPSATGSRCNLYLVLVLLCVCYFGKYFCTSDMYIVETLFRHEEGISSQQLSSMFALGYFASIFGKLCAGPLCDAVGGRFVILLSASGYIASTLLFSLVPAGPFSVAGFLVLWAAIGFFALGLAWVAVVAVATNWIPAPYLGRLMGLVSMAPQLGDAIARVCLSPALVSGWRAVFRVGALAALGLTLPLLLFVSNEPSGGGHAELGDRVKDPKSAYLRHLKVLLARPFLWLLCLLSGSLYGTRTLFLLYSAGFLTAAYCHEASDRHLCVNSGATMAATARASASYTVMGCLSVLVVGVLKDKLPTRHRGATLTLFTVPLLMTLAFLWHSGENLQFGFAASLVAFIGFCLFGPYKVLGAVFAVDVGGKELKSTCTAFMGIFDNVFAMVMLMGKGYIGSDWRRMFGVLTALCVVSSACAACVWLLDIWGYHHRHSSSVAERERPLLAGS